MAKYQVKNVPETALDVTDFLGELKNEQSNKFDKIVPEIVAWLEKTYGIEGSEEQ